MDDESGYNDQSPSTAHMLRWISKALFAAYLFAVAAQSLPVRLISANWRLDFVNSLVDNASIPLVGLGFAHLAVYLAPRDLSILVFRQRVSRWAVLASLGFLLMIPLQFTSAISLYLESANARVKDLDKADLRLNDFGVAIQNASTIEQLQSALIGFQGLSLSDADRAKPVSALRGLLNERINEARKILKERRRMVTAKPLDPTLLLIRSLRVVATSFFFALAFAACAQRPNQPLSLLEEFKAGSLRWLEALVDRREQRLAQRAEWEQQRQEEERLAAFEVLRRQQQELEALEAVNDTPLDSPSPPASLKDYYTQIMVEQDPASTQDDGSDESAYSPPPPFERESRFRRAAPGPQRPPDAINTSLDRLAKDGQQGQDSETGSMPPPRDP